MPKKMTTESFIAKAKSVHNDKYDYSTLEYTNAKTHVTIICPIEGHGKFKQRPNDHVSGKHGCPLCAVDNKKPTTQEFIERAKSVHNDKYDYSKVQYTNSYTPVTIICPIESHGLFKQQPNNHVNKKHGCPSCGGVTKPIQQEFIANAKSVHGDRYDYSKVEYINTITHVTIICPIEGHGEFTQIPDSHVNNKSGCPLCAAESHTGSYNYKTILRKLKKEPHATLNLYYIKLKNHDIWKVGLENKKFSRWSKKKVQYIFSIKFGMLEAFNLEQKLIKKRVVTGDIIEIFKKEFINKGGYTEISSKPFFTDDELEYFKENKFLKDISSLELFFAK